MTSSPILTLEPLIEAVRTGVEASGWELSGLQKTTSHQFEGRWDGESTRSAYLFFHPPSGPEWASVDAYLDETSRGVGGNLALVADLRPLGRIGSGRELIGRLAELSRRHVDARYRRPLTVRFRLEDVSDDAEAAETEARIKVRFPRTAVSAGPEAVERLVREAMESFERLVAAAELRDRADGAS